MDDRVGAPPVEVVLQEEGGRGGGGVRARCLQRCGISLIVPRQVGNGGGAERALTIPRAASRASSRERRREI